MPRGKRTYLRRGSVYLVVLGSALIVSVIGVSALVAVQTRQRASEGGRDFVATRYQAQAAVELGMLMVNENDAWREEQTDGEWYSAEPLGLGSFTLNVRDPADDDLQDGPCDGLILTGFGAQGPARYGLQVLMRSDALDFDPLFEEVMAHNPVGYWRLGDSDTTARDETGTQGGTYRNGVSQNEYVPFRCDPAARFDGMNDYVEIPHSDAYLLDTGAIMFWFRAANTSTTQGIFSKDSADYDTGGHLTVWLAGGYIQVRIQSISGSRYAWAGPVSANDWHQVVVGFGDDGLLVFLDGVWRDYTPYFNGIDDSSGGSGNHEPIGLGVSASDTDDLSMSNWTSPFRGMIDEVAIFDHTLWEDDVQALYDAGMETMPHTMSVIPGSWRRVVD